MVQEIKEMAEKKIVEKTSMARIPEDLAKWIDDFVRSPEGRRMGFRSRADFVTRASRNYMEQNLTPIDIPTVLREAMLEAVRSGKFGYRTVEECAVDLLRKGLREIGYLK